MLLLLVGLGWWRFTSPRLLIELDQICLLDCWLVVHLTNWWRLLRLLVQNTWVFAVRRRFLVRRRILLCCWCSGLIFWAYSGKMTLHGRLWRFKAKRCRDLTQNGRHVRLWWFLDRLCWFTFRRKWDFFLHWRTMVSFRGQSLRRWRLKLISTRCLLFRTPSCVARSPSITSWSSCKHFKLWVNKFGATNLQGVLGLQLIARFVLW